MFKAHAEEKVFGAVGVFTHAAELFARFGWHEVHGYGARRVRLAQALQEFIDELHAAVARAVLVAKGVDGVEVAIAEEGFDTLLVERVVHAGFAFFGVFLREGDADDGLDVRHAFEDVAEEQHACANVETAEAFAAMIGVDGVGGEFEGVFGAGVVLEVFEGAVDARAAGQEAAVLFFLSPDACGHHFEFALADDAVTLGHVGGIGLAAQVERALIPGTFAADERLAEGDIFAHDVGLAVTDADL